MLKSLKEYVYERRVGLSKTVAFSGGLYVARRYLHGRLEEVKWKLEQEQSSKDALKRRFRQTQEDVSYTVLAVLPTLAEQLLEQMDVEALTQELQSLSKARKQQHVHQQLPLTTAIPQPEIGNSPRSMTSSLVSSAEIITSQEEINSESESAARSVTSFASVEPPSPAVSNSASWVEASASVSQLSADLLSSRTTSQSGEGEEQLSASMISLPVSEGSTSSETRSKAELWNEVKMLTLTRLLTALYSTTLLCLLTTIQLTLLARGRYVQSVIQQEKEERMREEMDAISLSGILMKQLLSSGLSGGGVGIEGLLGFEDEENVREEGQEWEVPEETKNKYLTMSWWLLHVGWKDVAERVRRGVEEVFEGVSLKTQLAAVDLHRLVGDVRRRVEYEVTFEGRERRVNFLSTLLPPTAETIQHVLVQGGIAPSLSTANHTLTSPTKTTLTSTLSSSQLSSTHPPSHPADLSASQPSLLADPYSHFTDRHFASLVEETRDIVNGSDFARVLEVCLDRGVEVLFEGVEGEVFSPPVTLGEGQEEKRLRLASLLPVLARWSRRMVNGLPSELVDVVLDMREVQCLSAIAFSKFEEKLGK
ncbi:Peroxin-3 [Cyathus striatus]|nr:Peroxin-3 [Cyathus striatus]